MLNVFITIDTELWPRSFDLRHDRIEDLYDRDILGQTPRGQFGIDFQMDVLDRHGLRGIFFVEPLHTAVVGERFLRETVSRIIARGHEVQLHPHPEWLCIDHTLPNGEKTFVRLLRELPQHEQARLIHTGIEILRDAGAPHLVAHRAGGYGINFDTLRALHDCGIVFDTSYNPITLGRLTDLPLDRPLQQPAWHRGVCEIPVSSFTDGTGRQRHTQLEACSRREMSDALLRAHAAGWYSFVIVLHSFELIRRNRESGTARPDRFAIDRFEALCDFLGRHRDKFCTAAFGVLDASTVPEILDPQPIESNLLETAWRYSEQLWRRLT